MFLPYLGWHALPNRSIHMVQIKSHRPSACEVCTSSAVGRSHVDICSVCVYGIVLQRGQVVYLNNDVPNIVCFDRYCVLHGMSCAACSGVSSDNADER